MPVPTLAEKTEVDEDAEVSLEVLELLRYDWEKDDGCREWTAEMTAVLTGAFDFVATVFVLVSPARSTSVFRFAIGSGTTGVVSISSALLICLVYRQLDPCLLWPTEVGGAIAVREFVAAAVNSAIVLLGDGSPYLVGCGSWETNCDGIVSGMIVSLERVCLHSQRRPS
jgi:hypothetical protein